MTYQLGFAMTQVAGHATHSQNLRQLAAADPTIQSTWCDISYYRPGGRVERMSRRLGKGQSLRPVVDLISGLGRLDVDAILVNTPLIGLYPRRVLDAPIMVDFDSTPALLAAMPEYAREERGGPAGGVKRRVQERFWDRTSMFHAWSDWAKESAVNDYGHDAEKIIVNPPGVDLDLWAPSLAERSDGSDRSRRLLFVGGDFQRKGGDIVLEWFRRSKLRDVELHLVTSEDLPDVENVTVHNDLKPNSDRLIELYQQSDLFVLPTRAECFGIATVEAMASGLPVVVGDVGASAEIVDHGRNGYLVQPGDIDELGNAISAILDDDTLRQQMAQRSRQIAETKFSLATNGAVTLSALKSLADESSAR